MSLSLLFRNTVLGCLVLTAGPGLLRANSRYAASGDEYAVAGSLAGDQTGPQLSVGSAGGFLVWQDNALGTPGTGIRAIALRSDFTRVPGPFRVNQMANGNQQNPQVALVKQGGAVFVWQGGSGANQNIYARFLSGSNTWLCGDLQVNTYSAKGARKHPVVAALANGNAVVLWSSYNQQSTTSMQDVYGQVLTPAGQKLGGEFLVNQFTPFNQRAPAVAALSGGGFVAVWVSEQENNAMDSASEYIVKLQVPSGLPSVDVYARTYDGTGAPTSSEFMVNTDLKVCSDPVVAPGPDGAFMIAWSQMDLAAAANGVDVFARPFIGGGTGGVAQRINTYLPGNQYLPQISGVGDNYLVAWTSLYQDGSGKGVYGRFLQADATPVAAEFRVNRTVVKDQMSPALGADPAGRFLAVWTSFVGGANSFDLYGQTYVCPEYVPLASGPTLVYAPPAYDPFLTGPGTPTATAAVAEVLGTETPALTQPAAPATATPVASPFVVAQGTYSGLFSDAAAAAALSSGAVSARITAGGAYSGKLVLTTGTYPFAGKLNPVSGGATNTIKRGLKLAPLTLHLHLDLTSGEVISGQVAATNWTAELEAYRDIFDARKLPASAFAGNYTMVIPADLAAPRTPAGHGYGLLRIDAAGNVIWSGALGDGTKVTQSTTLSRQGFWPLFLSLYGGNGLVMSWMQFTNQTACDLSGQTIWLKGATPAAKYYPNAFTNDVTTIGSRYVAPPARTRLLGMTNGLVILGGPEMSLPLTNGFCLDALNRVVRPAGSKLSLSLNLASGSFTASTVNPQTKRSLVFQGVLLQKTANGFGYYLGTNQSGQVFLGPQP